MFYHIQRVTKQGAAKFCSDKFDVFVIMFDGYRQSCINRPFSRSGHFVSADSKSFAYAQLALFSLRR